MEYKRKGFSDDELIVIYKQLMLPRLIEDKMLILLRQGRISKWFSGYGQEAVSVGSTIAMDSEEYILPMHRNLGIFTTRNVPLDRLFAQFQGKAEGFTKGRDRSFHFGSIEHRLVGMISHLGPQLGVADGIALANKLSNAKQATLVVTGDGGASEGDFHEALNTAAVWELPVIFMVENNQWGLSTPSSEQFRCKQFIDKGIGYGITAVQVDGNNILEVITAVKEVAEQVRQTGKPILLEMMTFRMRGHEEASGTKYYPKGLQEKWVNRDPVENFERFLIDENVLTESLAKEIKASITDEIASSLELADSYPRLTYNEQEELQDLFAEAPNTLSEAAGELREIRFIDAIAEAMDEAMKRWDNLVLMGQDIGKYGGVFKITDGLLDKYGAGRVRNTPLCESAILGAAIGLSIKGHKAMMEMQFADFVSEGMTQICNNMAKLHWRWGQHVDAVVRMPTGAGVAAGPFHSQSNEAWFTHVPGLKVVYPAFPEDAKGLLLSAFNDPNPIMFFEHKALYRSLKGEVPAGYFETPIGKARIVKPGKRLTIVSYGMGVHWALEIAESYGDQIEVIDLRTLVPLDLDTITSSVQRTNRVLVLHEDCSIGGYGGEIVTQISETCFEWLDAPVKRVGSSNTPVPFAPELEEGFLAKSRLKEAVTSLLDY